MKLLIEKELLFNLWLLIKLHVLAIYTLLCKHIQGSRVCSGEAVPQLAERCPRLGSFQKQILGDTNTTMGVGGLLRGESIMSCDSHVTVM